MQIGTDCLPVALQVLCNVNKDDGPPESQYERRFAMDRLLVPKTTQMYRVVAPDLLVLLCSRSSHCKRNQWCHLKIHRIRGVRNTNHIHEMHLGYQHIDRVSSSKMESQTPLLWQQFDSRWKGRVSLQRWCVSRYSPMNLYNTTLDLPSLLAIFIFF